MSSSQPGNSFSDSMSGSAVLDAILDEQRCTPREPQVLKARVKRLGTAEIAEAVTRNISEGGLFLTVAPSAALSVGERCELELFDASGSPLACLAGNTCYATVVRTETPRDPSQQQVGAGLRFDNPLYL